MSFWSTHFHKSDGEEASLNTIRHLKHDITAIQVVLGNENTEHTVVHDVESLKVSKLDRRDFDSHASRLREDLARVRQMRGPQGLGWLSGEGSPDDGRGRTGDFYLDTLTLRVYKKLNTSWAQFAQLQGPPGREGPRGPPGLSSPFHLYPFIEQHAYYLAYVHPSRFESLVRIVSGSYRASNMLDFTGKTIPLNNASLSKDQRFYATLSGSQTISLRERFDRLFEENKAFAIFQVFQVNATSRLIFTPFSISTIGSNTLDSLQVNVHGDSIIMEGFTWGTTRRTLDNPAGVLSSALGQTANPIGDLRGQTVVMSFSRDLNGLFTIYINSILLYSHMDTNPFRRVNGIEECDYAVGCSGYGGDTSSRFYCQLHFAKSLDQNTVQRIHAELMTHYGV